MAQNTLNAQVFGTPPQGEAPQNPNVAPAAYFFGQEQGILIDVNLWGQVGRPGKYYVPYATDLVSLLSIAGGPATTAKLDDIRIIRYARADTAVIEKVVRVDVEKFIETGEQSFPALLRGDTVIVPGGPISVLNTIVTITNAVFSIVNAIFLIVILNRELSR
ncbi:MAG: hypothetical protein RMI34_05495 [Chloroherpetonaceae bacterium]|nr:hypothetical protein [Chloroherpetonaceae bacterium]MCS7211594.1 hypothetical protein [Chloroherpetonaceae bacterium]MDW8019514.1 hypothetical protein [Chloroherpetonaceae bacterium]MDW8466430.1 hypothetical protein [Chloroherpetonaceae bacterium]